MKYVQVFSIQFAGYKVIYCIYWWPFTNVQNVQEFRYRQAKGLHLISLKNHHFTQLKFLTILSIIYIEPLIIQVDFKYLTTYVQKLQTWLLGDHTINYLTILIEDGSCSKGRFKKYLL